MFKNTFREFAIHYRGLKDEKEHILLQIRRRNTKNCNFLNFLNTYASGNPQITYTPGQNGSEVNQSVLKYFW